MTPDDDRYNASPRSARSVKLSTAATPPGGRDVLAAERIKMQERECQLNDQVHDSYKTFLQKSSQKKRDKDFEHWAESSLDSLGLDESGIARTLDYDLNSSTLSGFEADSEQVESGTEPSRSVKLPQPGRGPPVNGMRTKDRRKSFIPNINPPAPPAKPNRSTSKKGIAGRHPDWI